ncbi:MAG: dTMP kinase [Rhodospirillaceae bacterium]|nr:dTMP kinase [Rhodospirillaceae bacterium]
MGLFVTFEGGEGSGKSTQITILANRLSQKNIPYITTREPGGAPGAELIRELLVKGEIDRWDGLSEALLLLAARRNHIEKTIKPALKAGKMVICDRFSDSTMAYQGCGHGLGRDVIEALENASCTAFKPDLTIILDIGLETGLARSVSLGGDELRFEELDLEFHSVVRNAFIEIAEREPGRCKLIDGSQNIEVISEKIIGYICSLIKIK